MRALLRRLGPNIRFRLSASNNFLYKLYYKYLYKPKPDTIGAFLDQFSRLLDGKVSVVQVGANDGVNHDPISKYIKRDGWTGVLLEPQKNIHDDFLRKVYARDLGIKTLCAAIGPEDGKATLYKIGWCNMRWASGLASFQRKTVEYAYSSGLVARAIEKHDLMMPDDEALHITTEDVEVISPATLIRKFKIDSISLLQIDTEGYDYEVIKMFDISTTQPMAIIYENMHLSEADKASCEEYLIANQYMVKDYGANTLALYSNIPESLVKFATS